MSFTNYEIYHLHEYVYSKTEIDNMISNINKKEYITIQVEKNGSINNGRFEWSFGNKVEMKITQIMVFVCLSMVK